MSLQFTPLKQITQIHAKVTDTFLRGKTLPLSYRRHQLLQLARMIKENQTIMEDTLVSDLGKPRLEAAVMELGLTYTAALHAAENLTAWTAPEKPFIAEDWRKSRDPTIHRVPKGAVLNIAPWNYPYLLTLKPLVGAIAAGCTCVTKPAELVPATSQFLADYMPKYLDSDAYDIVNGTTPETTELLNHKWDHIFFTGSARVGRIVASIAGKQLTPLTLELGGKSPVVIDDDCDLEIAARRVLYGKAQNTGQLCVSPDYVLIGRHRMDEFVEGLKKAHAEFWPKDVFDPEMAWGKIVSPANHARIRDMVERTRGEIVFGAKYDGDRRIAPTVVKNVALDDSLMSAEIFGPVLPLVPVDNIDHAIKIIREGKEGTPLVVYAFTNSDETKQKLLQQTRSGSLIFNDTTSQLLVPELPFGGAGNSGYGSWFSKDSFDVFTHRRSSVDVPYQDEPVMANRYPPYTQERYDLACYPLREEVPKE